MTTRILLLASFVLTTGCVTATPDDECFTCGKADGNAISLSACEEERFLLYVAASDQDTLDNQVGLDSRAAEGIAKHGPIASLEALDAIPYVGKNAFESLVDYARNDGLFTTCESLSYEECDAMEDTILACQAAQGASVADCAASESISVDNLNTCCNQNNAVAATFCGLGELTVVENDPNTEFMETFSALNDEAVLNGHACKPWGAAFSYNDGPSPYPGDVTVALGVWDSLYAGMDVTRETIKVGVDDRLEDFLASFDFDEESLLSAIGNVSPGQFSVTEMTTGLGGFGAVEVVMLLNFPDDAEVWAIGLECGQ